MTQASFTLRGKAKDVFKAVSEADPCVCDCQCGRPAGMTERAYWTDHKTGEDMERIKRKCWPCFNTTSRGRGIWPGVICRGV